MRSILAAALALSFAVACGGKNNADDDGDGGNNKPDACVGIECQVVDCQKMSLPPTSISGTVFAPNGTLPLFGVSVYVPRDPVPPFSDALVCEQCNINLPGSPVVQTISDEAGNFRLDNVPAGADIPLVITIGKWRRQITIPNVAQCGDNALGAADTRLPKTKAEGDIPKIALTTGNADSLECLVRKLGVDDSEISSTAGGAGRVHFYHGNGVAKFKGGFAGAGGQLTLPSATPFWSDFNSLKSYDIVFLSCEGKQNSDTKPQTAMDAMKAYADAGGRVFASHWHNIWIGGVFQPNNPGNQKPAVWDTIATWDAGQGDPGLNDLIDEVSNPKGASFATWMLNVMGSTTRDAIVLQDQTDRATAVTLDTTKAELWVKTQAAGQTPQMFQFTTPNEVQPDARCGKVVFTDMHVSGGPGGGDYPDSCGTNNNLSAQEKALAFMFFDISSCVGGLF